MTSSAKPDRMAGRIRLAWLATLGLVLGLLAGQSATRAQDSLDRDYADQLPRIKPLSPQLALSEFELADSDLALELVASEPMVMDPVAIAFDEWGRAFVVEMRGYSERQDQKLGRIKLLEDTDADGQYDRATVFADGFRWPTAVVCFRGGILVGDAPDIVFLKDSDGDRRADVREPLVTGFGTSNVQQLPNNFQWAIDNQIYGASGGNGGVLRPVASGNRELDVDDEAWKPVNIRGRDFQLNPQSLQVSAISGGTQFGMTFDSFGNRYACSNSNHCQQFVFENRYAGRNPWHAIGQTRINIATDGPAAEVFRISPTEPWRTVRTRLRVQGLVRGPVEGGGRAAGYFTSATGLTCYDGHLLPPRYRGNLFVGDVGSNLVHRKQLQGEGIQRRAIRTEFETEFLRTTDNWFRPVQLANAPDGSLVILDMYREVIEHPASLPPIIKQHLDLNSGNSRGRLYRVVPARQSRPEFLIPGKASLEQLVQMLEHPNGWHRRTAARLLFEKSLAHAAREIAGLLRSRGLNSSLPEARIRAMYLLAASNRVKQTELEQLLSDDHPAVRVHALRLAERQFDETLEDTILKMVNDPDRRVRFQVALTLGELTVDISAALVTLAVRDGNDSWMQMAIANSAAGCRGDVVADLVRHINEEPAIESRCRSLVLDLVRQICLRPVERDEAALTALFANWPAGQEMLLGEVLIELQNSQKKLLVELLRDSGQPAPGVVFRTIVAKAQAVALDESEDDQIRARAVRLFQLADGSQFRALLARALELQQPPSVKSAAIGLATRFDPEVSGILIEKLPSMAPPLRSTATQVLLRRPASTLSLLAELESGKLSPLVLSAANRQLLLRHPDPVIRRRADQVFGGQQNPDRIRLVADYLESIDPDDGDIDRGRALFRKSCTACHRLENLGSATGPNLAAFANRGAAAIVANVLDPNREVDPRYLTYLVRTYDGQLLEGMILDETASSVSLQSSDGKTHTILRAEIEELKSTAVSLMPENLETEIDQAAMQDLVAYLLSQSG